MARTIPPDAKIMAMGITVTMKEDFGIREGII